MGRWVNVITNQETPAVYYSRLLINQETPGVYYSRLLILIVFREGIVIRTRDRPKNSYIYTPIFTFLHTIGCPDYYLPP